MMLIYMLNCLRMINEEVQRLEGVRKETYKSPDCEKRSNYEKNLAKCKEELKKKKKELEPYKTILKIVLKDKGDIEMAYNYYFKGKSWEDSYKNSSLYADLDIDSLIDDTNNFSDEENDEKFDKSFREVVNSNSRRIKRKLQNYYKPLE